MTEVSAHTQPTRTLLWHMLEPMSATVPGGREPRRPTDVSVWGAVELKRS